MRAVNLLPGDLERESSQGGRTPIVVAGGGIAAVTTAALVLFMSASGSAADQRSQLESIRASIVQVPSPGQPAVAPGAFAQQRADRVAALAAAMSTRVPVDRLLRELAFVLPEDAWLTGLTATAPAGSPGSSAPSAAATPGVTIQGATYSQQSVARVLARLAALPVLSDVRLSASARRDPLEGQSGDGETKTGKKAKKSKPVVTFTITAIIRPGGAS